MVKRKNVSKRTEAVTITGAELHLGHTIVDRRDMAGKVTKTITVHTITRGECGKGMHVNGSLCFDKAMLVEVFA